MTFSQDSIMAINEAKKYFDSLGIDLPPIPGHLVNDLHAFQPDLFGTRPEALSIYDLKSFIQEAISTPKSDYILFGVGGYGIKSTAMHYYCVTDKAALFYQFFFGVPEIEDKIETQNRFNALFYSIELLLDVIEEKHAQKLIPEGQRLLIIESDFYGQGWGWINRYPGLIDSATWHDEEPVTLSALNAVVNA